MELGERIRRLRKDKHMTQEELARSLGLQKSAIAKYENGRVSNIKKATLLKMAEIFEISPSYLLGMEEYASGTDPEIAMLTEYFQKLNRRGKDKVLENLSDLVQIPAYQAQGTQELMQLSAAQMDKAETGEEETGEAETGEEETNREKL